MGEQADTDIWLVDVDRKEVLAAWDTIKSKAAQTASEQPAIMISRDPQADGPAIRRPLVATRVLSAFDQLVLTLRSGRIDHAFTSQTATSPRHQRRSPPASVTQPLPQTDSHASCRALVVDDCLPVRRQLEIELQALGAEVDLAENAEQGELMVQRHRYDIVFLDVVLPGMDGYEMCRRIKRNRATKQTPVVMLTSKSSPFDRINGTLAGCNNYLTKPVDRDIFLKVLRGYLPRKFKA